MSRRVEIQEEIVREEERLATVKSEVEAVAPQNTPLCEPALCHFWPTFNVIYARKGV